MQDRDIITMEVIYHTRRHSDIAELPSVTSEANFIHKKLIQTKYLEEYSICDS